MTATPTLLVVSSGARQVDGIVADSESAPQDAILEVRIDLLEDATPAKIATLRKRIARPLLATVRSEREGGAFLGGLKDAARLLNAADHEGFEWVDLEQRVAEIVERGNARRVVSWHAADDLLEVPLIDRVRALADADADVVKVAATHRDPGLALSFVQEAMSAGDAVGKPIVAIAMGPYGRWLRPLAARFQMPLFYVAAREHKKTAPGQITRQDAEMIYRWRRIGPDTRVFAVVGADVTHSLSPRAHNEVFCERGDDAVYVPMDARDLDSLPMIAAGLPLEGVSVTAPHKLAALEIAGSIDEAAAGAGACNTLFRERGSEPDALLATNTDAAGFIAGVEFAIQSPADALALCVGKTLDPLLRLDGENALRESPLYPIRRALVFGTGGAARAVAWGLIRRKVRVAVIGRDANAAIALALQLGHGTEALSPSRAASQSFELLVKATPEAPERMFDPFDFSPRGLAADVVYTPLDTDWLLAARRVGRTPVPGLLMFSEQAALQAARFTGRPAHEVRPAIVRGIAAGLGRSPS